MIGYSFSRAVGAVLSELGRSADTDVTSPRHLKAALHGQGLSVSTLQVADGQWPNVDMAAALLDMGNDLWLVVLPRLHGFDIIGPEGAPVPAPETITHAGHAIILTHRLDIIKEFIPFLRRHKGLLLEIVLSGLLINCLALLFPLFSRFVYDKVLGNGISATLWALMIGLLLSVGLDYTVRAIRAILMERFAVASEADIDHALFRSVLSSNAAKIPPVGLVLEKYKQILGNRDFLSSAYMLSALDIPFLFLYLLVLYMVAGPLVFVPIGVGILVIAVHALFSIPSHDYERQARKAGEERFALLADTLAIREVIIGSRLRNELARRWHRAANRAGTAAGRARYWHSLAQSFSFAGSNLAYMGGILGGAYMVDSKSLTSGGLLAATMLISRSMSTIMSVVLLVTRYREFRQALRGLDDLIPQPAGENAEPLRREGIVPQLQLVNVSCSLRQGSRPTLQDISASINPGEMVGLVGHPGAGKTTLLRLMAGVLPPDSGDVLLGNIPLPQLSPGDVSDLIGYKPQEPTLLDGTIEDNIRAGNWAASQQDINRALTVSGLAHAMTAGELNLTTPVGPRGSALSGGQRQMLAMARAVLGAPPVLLLDEPNTGLDGPLETQLAETLGSLRPGRVIVISTHSRVMLSHCTRIIVLERGRIITDGPRERVLGS